MRPSSSSAIRSRVSLLSYTTLIALALAIAATVVGSFALHKILKINQLEIVTGLFQNLPTALSPSQTDTTLVVTGCTNVSISGTNDVIKDGKVMFANTCPVIEDNICQEHICGSNGICARRTVVGGECSGDAQCLDLFGPGYVCNLTLCSCEVMVPVNGSMYTNSLVCSNNGTMGVVMVMDAECPTLDQVLTATDSSHATWQDPNRELPCDTGDVVISNATCPTTGQVLTATSSGTAEWQDVTMAIASEIECATGNIIVSNATCPTTGQVLTATSSGTAEWQTPSSVSQITASGSVNFPVPWSTPMSFTATATGNDVTISFFTTSGLSSGASTAVSNAAIPVAYRPDVSASMLYPVSEGVTSFLGLLTVSSGGTVTIGRSTTNGAFAGGASFSFGQGFRHTITYPLIS